MSSVNNNFPSPVANGTPASAFPQVPHLGSNPIDTTLSDTWLLVRKRKWIILAAALLGAIIGVMSALSTPKVYEAEGTIQVHPGSSEQYRVDASNNSNAGGDDIGVKLETEVSVLQSEQLELQVARRLQLQNDRNFYGSKRPVPRLSLDNPAVTLNVLYIFHKSLAVKRVPKTELITISYTSVSPELSSNIVNTLIDYYIERSYKVRFASTQKVSGWLGEQLNDLKDDVESSQEKLVGLQRQLGVIGLDEKHNLVADQLEDLTKAMTEARLARIIAETKYRVMESTPLDLIEPDATNETTSTAAFAQSGNFLNTQRALLVTDETQRAQLATAYGNKWPDVVAMDKQIEKTKASILTEEHRVLLQSAATFRAAKANEDASAAALDAKETDAFKSQDALVQYGILQRRFESSRDLYEGLTRRLREASIQAGLQSSEIDIVDPALIPIVPTGPRRSIIVLLSVLFGVIGGVGMAFLLESLDTSLRSIAEIEAVMELPSLAVIPRARRNLAQKAGETTPAIMRNIDVISQPKSQFSEAFRSLRTSLLLSTVGNPPRVILVTSSIPSEGKTTIATNIAAALSQRDVRVLLIDADLRRPTVHHRFGVSAKTGLTTVLANTTRLEDTLQKLRELPNLDILASGPVPPFPTEMIASERMAQILNQARTEYQHVVIDSPPILSVTDGVILARMSDAVALVMRHGGVSKHIVRRSRDLLMRAGAPLTGIILNAVDISSPDYYGYYGYYRYSYISASEPVLGAQDDSTNGHRPGTAEQK
jgi:capsular exopolysaccharide synthesis family protein